MQIGYLIACIRSSENSYCLLQKLSFIAPARNSPVTNDYDCPLLKVRKEIILIKSTNIITDVSVIHHCTDDCEFIQTSEELIVEREKVQAPQLTLKHDYSNNIYYLNIYALSCK